MKTTQNTIITSEIITSDGKVFASLNAEVEARAHERNILARKVLTRMGYPIKDDSFNSTDLIVLNAVLESFDALVHKFHEENVMTPGYGTRDDF